ncbi:MAG: 2-polyprenyl-6-methoxyphenol hydroxylase-like oxidoreductase, partial [Chloroflexi bacterium]|nr:2-polyprenyl-6-methoxyphenol hydroxylase-like oxidoreductase [Chloroflexota bacterium]
MTTYLARGTAVIIGGSLAGLLTARVLAEHFEQVLIVERDSYPDEPVARAGVPQSHQWHGIMARGYHALQRLYPELTARLAASGVPLPDTLQEYIVYSAGGVGYLPRWESGITIPVCSRPLLEWHIRQLTLKRPSIRTIQQCEVTGLVLNEARTAVSAIKLRYRSGAAKSGSETISAALVVDASGRYSRNGQWLQAVG